MRKGFRSDAQNALNEFHFSKVNNQPDTTGISIQADHKFLAAIVPPRPIRRDYQAPGIIASRQYPNSA